MEANQLQEVIEKGFKDLRVELDEKFGKIDKRFEKIDGRLGKIDSQFAELRREVRKVGENASLARVEIENLRHDFGIVREGEPSQVEQRVSALEVRVTKLERRRTKKKSGNAAE